MKISIDTKQRVQSGLIFCLEFYKVIMGSFLSVFVPQQCDDHICSMTETVQRQVACFAFNVISCISLLYLYFIELRRENWCITYLDIDPALPNNNLDTEIETYPKIKDEMKKINTKYRRHALVCLGFQGVNVILSTIYIGLHWSGSIALAPLIGYIILMCSKLYNTVFISDTSLKKERAFSAYLTISKTYNTIDEDHRQNNPNKV